MSGTSPSHSLKYDPETLTFYFVLNTLDCIGFLILCTYLLFWGEGFRPQKSECFETNARGCPAPAGLAVQLAALLRDGGLWLEGAQDPSPYFGRCDGI